MTCFMCKGDIELKVTTFTVDVNGCVIIVKNVPSMVCSQCGDVTYTNEVARELERIVQRLKDSLTEIAVVDYNKEISAA